MNTWGLVKTMNYSGESWSDDEYLEMVDEMMNTWGWAETLIILKKVGAMTNT